MIRLISWEKFLGRKINLLFLHFWKLQGWNCNLVFSGSSKVLKDSIEPIIWPNLLWNWLPNDLKNSSKWKKERIYRCVDLWIWFRSKNFFMKKYWDTFSNSKNSGFLDLSKFLCRDFLIQKSLWITIFFHRKIRKKIPFFCQFQYLDSLTNLELKFQKKFRKSGKLSEEEMILKWS